MFYRCLAGLIVLTVVAFGQGAKDAGSERPITLYPDFAVEGSRLVAFINQHARERDAVVLSHTDVLKSTYRITKLGIQRGAVWLYVPRDLALFHGHASNLEGITGIAFIPDRRAERRQTAERLADDAHAHNATFVVGLEPRQAMRFSEVEDLARSGDVFLIYKADIMRTGGEAYRSYVTRLARTARETKPGIALEVGIATAEDDAQTRRNAATLHDCADVTDRIAIFCGDTDASYASLETLYALLRPQQPFEGQK